MAKEISDGFNFSQDGYVFTLNFHTSNTSKYLEVLYLWKATERWASNGGRFRKKEKTK